MKLQPPPSFDLPLCAYLRETFPTFRCFDAFKVRYLLDGVLVKGFGCFLRVLHFTGKAFNFDFEFTDTLAPSLLVVDAAEVFDLGPQEA
ncbi:hypothetical protein HBH92_172570 [Parastagonospora nodorum]|nr:hypothetical protein HBH52_012820 [Parastagonospora nodorum]KAH4056924.1 hypothetical protein HBH49_039180 [Parastagonospora nodorum]KAH4377169.1 hypothetical protein HBH99_208000 [Parastagonospora nodorum]KAH4405951.1 hypothetical protein HBH92_172570 [Parastagonospora nodorum]KAH4562305.1 hypothetical protein HBH86_055300 [Parastagonospora nodorum]